MATSWEIDSKIYLAGFGRRAGEDGGILYAGTSKINYTWLYGFETYLNPEIGQGNINCDPEISDFNEIVIRDQDADPQYYHILIVRQGDLENKEIFFTVPEGMKEEKVYLLKYYEYDLDLMESKIYEYIEQIKNEIDIY